MITVGDLFFMSLNLPSICVVEKGCQSNFNCKSKVYFFHSKWNLPVRFKASVDAFFNFLLQKLRNSLKKREKFSKCL